MYKTGGKLSAAQPGLKRHFCPHSGRKGKGRRLRVSLGIMVLWCCKRASCGTSLPMHHVLCVMRHVLCGMCYVSCVMCYVWHTCMSRCCASFPVYSREGVSRCEVPMSSISLDPVSRAVVRAPRMSFRLDSIRCVMYSCRDRLSNLVL